MSSKSFGEIIKEKRNMAGYTQSETADMLYITRSTYNHYEKGARTPSIDVLLRMARLYNLNPLDLLTPLIPTEYIADFYLPTTNTPVKYTDDRNIISFYNQTNIN